MRAVTLVAALEMKSTVYRALSLNAKMGRLEYLRTIR
jgi:hypothetical protein